MMKEKLEQIRAQAAAALKNAADERSVDEIRIQFLGKKGELTSILKQMGSLSAEERPKMGQLANEIRGDIENTIAGTMAAMKKRALDRRLEKETLDVTIPGKKPALGRLHPLNSTLNQLIDIFRSMGFDVVDGPEVENDYYNFEALNVPKDHPARDMQDTFYVNDRVVLRTHTSPLEARALLNLKPPFRLIMPGRVFRVDEVDASHSPVFMQMEGFVVDKNLTLADLKGTLLTFIHTVFGEDVKMRFRPSYFPFTEPSAEVDISCTLCGGKGCRLCKGTGWLEILGCGVTNPHELENCGLDPHEWKAIAFGVGVDRIASLKYGITDIRLEYENDARFLKQF